MDRTKVSARQAQYFNNFSRQDTDEEKPQKEKSASTSLKRFVTRPSWTTKLSKHIQAKLANFRSWTTSKAIRVDFDKSVGTQESLHPSPNVPPQQPAQPQSSARQGSTHKNPSFLTVPIHRRNQSRKFRRPTHDPVRDQELIIPTTKLSVEAQAKDAPVPPIIITYEDMNKGFLFVAPFMSGEALAGNRSVDQALGTSCHGAEVVEGTTVYFDTPKFCKVVPASLKTLKEVSAK
jgi:hypothetical protein